MSWYANSQLSLSEGGDYGEKECPDCEGEGKVECDWDIDGNPIAVENCHTCDGYGTVEKDIDDAIDDEWDAFCED